ncbi:MAG: hypothetical protein A2Y94_03460 [Caldithrix sp. RBG_13_44_9]|nr:MAG: hypothetical protein A2Y94_03460 [Caldithrix sp. RBG_13_44_9]
MTAPISNIGRLVEILNSLNNFIKNYSIYIYVIDTNYRLIWANNYVRDKFHLIRLPKKISCHYLFWGSKLKCEDCPVAQVMEKKQVQRHILQRRFPHKAEKVYLEIISMPILNRQGDVEGLLFLGVDVTPLEKKQSELRQQEKLFLSIVDSSSDAIMVMDKENKITSWNRGAQDIFGYTPKEILGKSVISLIPKELIELGEMHYIQKELSSQGFIRNYETQRLHKNGRIIYVDLISSVLRNEEGMPIGHSVMMKDISARKGLELELRRTILELSKLNELNEILYTTYVLDDILRIILIAITAGEGLKFNRAFLLLRNTATDILEGHIAIGPANESEAKRIWMELQDRIRTLKEIVKEYEVDLQGSDREINEIVRRIAVPCREDENILIQALHQRKAYHVVKGKITQLKKYRFDIDGHSLIDILGNDTFLIVPLFTKKEPLGIIIADNKFTRRDIREDDIGALRFFANQASMAIENAMLYDRLEDRIHELQDAYKKLETSSNRLVTAERLAAVGKMAASVAHEIRNPLVSVGGFARLLERKLPRNEELHKYASIIIQQVDHLEYILNNILSVASPRKPRYSAFDIHRVLHQLLNIMDDIIHKRKVKVVLQFQCKESLVLGDEKMIFQAMLNVLKNAMEALSDERTLTLKTECDKKYVKISLHDSGRGISRENLEKIYDPFFTTKTEGTGLGLAVVRQIIEDHHGKIEIHSKERRGTTVQIFLPRSQRTPKSRQFLERKQKIK